MAANQTRLNFWQWLGIILLVGGLAWYAYDHWIKPNQTPAKPASSQAPATNPIVTAPPTQPAR